MMTVGQPKGYLNKIGLVSGLVVSGIAVSSILSPVRADNIFNLNFYDSSNNLVGSGQFTDSQSGPKCFATSINNPNDCLNEVGNQIYVTHLVNNFSANIPNFDNPWYPAGPFWYEDTSISQAPGSLAYSQYGPSLEPNRWLFSGNDSITNPLPDLYMDFSSASSTSAFGSFMALNLPFSFLNGTFTATLVPEPSGTLVPEPLNILGATTGLVLFGTASTALKRRKLTK